MIPGHSAADNKNKMATHNYNCLYLIQVWPNEIHTFCPQIISTNSHAEWNPVAYKRNQYNVTSTMFCLFQIIRVFKLARNYK